jgi:hypothetical protein
MTNEQLKPIIDEIMNFEFRDNLIKKLENGERLKESEIRHIELLLTVDECYERILDEYLGFGSDDFKLKYK